MTNYAERMMKIENGSVRLETNSVYALPENGFVTYSGNGFLDITIKDGLIITGESTGNDYVTIGDDTYYLFVSPKRYDGPQAELVFE